MLAGFSLNTEAKCFPGYYAMHFFLQATDLKPSISQWVNYRELFKNLRNVNLNNTKYILSFINKENLKLLSKVFFFDRENNN